MRAPFLLLAWALAGSALVSFAAGKEVTSNGLGGGRWSEGSTWRGGVVPTAEDDAVIGARDSVLFDRNDVETPTCKQLILDPASNLAFQSGLGKRTLSVDGAIELHGSLKMHAAALTDEMEIRLVSAIPADRAIKMNRGAALLILGRPDLPNGKRNVAITVLTPAGEKIVATGTLTAGQRTMVDLQNARVENVAFAINGIDNTGAKPNERCNFTGNRFSGYSTVGLQSCDTPALVRNEFEAQKNAMVRPYALGLSSCPLADIRGNRIIGQYAIGISIASSECSAVENTIENCAQGIAWHTGSAMLKGNIIRNCHTGLSLRTTTGSAEETAIDGGELPISTASAKVQLTSVVITNPGKGVLMEFTASAVGLLNCNVRPEQVKSIRDAALPRMIEGTEPAVDTMQFLVVGLKGTVPPRASIEVATSNPATPRAPGAADLNVRNSPAPVRPSGLTALPQSLTPLIVRSWKMDEDNKVVPAPEYTLSVLEPAAETGGNPRVLKSLKIKPEEAWFREKPNDPKPTLEVTLP